MTTWEAVAVLPNLALANPIECEFLALAPWSDNRVRALCDGNANLKTFLGRFTDAFRRRIFPSVILARADAPRTVMNTEAIAGFRDAIAVSVTSRGRALELQYPKRVIAVKFSDAFSFYPWMLARDHQHLILRTPSMLALDAIEDFRGQSFPESAIREVHINDIDWPLLNELLDRWKKRFSSSRASWHDRALFRSLNMANQASRAPAGIDATLFDYGRATALWVSAFEILAHPGGNGKSQLSTVYDVLEAAPWHSKALRTRLYKAQWVPKSQLKRRIPASWLYGLIYKARNDFLHGNPVTGKGLSVPRTRAGLFVCASPLYRMALTSFLDLRWKEPTPERENAQVLGKWIADRSDFQGYQKRIEEGLLAAIGKDKSHLVAGQRMRVSRLNG